MIEVRCEPHEILSWEKEKEKARGSVDFFWKLSLGMEQIDFPIHDEMHLATLRIAVQEFVRELLPIGGRGVILYRGTLELDRLQREMERPDSPFAGKAFAIDCYANYFQILAHCFPDDTPLFVLFECLESSAETLALISRPSLEHFQVALKDPQFFRRGWRWDEGGLFQVTEGPKKGQVFPMHWDGVSKPEMKDFEIVLESKLNEEWDGLEEIHLLSQKLSERGERMLKGFEAAGGKVIRGRGI